MLTLTLARETSINLALANQRLNRILVDARHHFLFQRAGSFSTPANRIEVAYIVFTCDIELCIGLLSYEM